MNSSNNVEFSSIVLHGALRAMNSISFIGSNILALSFPICLYSILMYLVGYKKEREGAIVSAERATYLCFTLISLASLLLIYAFVTNHFELNYVFNYSSKSLPLFYKITGLWAGLDGSILLWTWFVSFYSVLVLSLYRKKYPHWMPFVNTIIMTNILFFLSLMLFAQNPFSPIHQIPTEDGKGLNPLLQNIAMVIHPPTLYLGFTGFVVPFAFGIAALITRKLDFTWIEVTRRWTFISWLFLTLGLLLGGAWAYVELGWGGFWAWDPVENAALMPWLLGTAYIHSVLIQKRRGMLMVWNASLVVLIFLFTILGTYLTRSGVVQSVHAFSESHLGPFFLYFMGGIFLFSFLLILKRLPYLKSYNTLTSFFSKESAFLLNNVILLIATLSILWATLFPTITEFFIHKRIIVGPPFFNTFMGPIALILLFLMGIGPMVSWKKVTLKNLKGNLTIPFIVGLAGSGITLLLGVKHWYVVGSILLITFVFGTLFLEFYRGFRVIRIQKKLSFLSSWMELFLHSNRRYGGYVVHVGILIVFIGIAGGVYKKEVDFSLKPGESFEYEGYTLTYVEPQIDSSSHRVALVSVIDLYQRGKKLKRLYPAQHHYEVDGQTTTEVDIYQSPFMDVYLVLGNLDTQTGVSEMRLMLNPLISFIWLGGFVILLGVLLVLLSRKGLKNPSQHIKSIILIIGFFLAVPLQHLMAQEDHDEHEPTSHHEEISSELNQKDPFVFLKQDDPLYQRIASLSEKVLCTCGGCVRTSLKTCTCAFAKKERGAIYSKIQSGVSDEKIIEDFVQTHGLSILTVPPKTGFFKIGYLMPSIILIVSFGLAFFILKRWFSRRLDQKLDIPKVSSEYTKQLLKEWEENR